MEQPSFNADAFKLIDQIRGLMDKPTNIRNMSVIAHGMFCHLVLTRDMHLIYCP